MKTFPQSPYFDDFSENKKFYQVLTRPSYPLQAREMQTIQSILQRQIESLGDHFFKEGAKIIDGQMSFDTDVTYVKIRDGYTTNIERLVGMTLTGNYSGTKATVVAVSLPENGDPATLFVKFVSSDTKKFTDSWSIGEVISEYSDIQIQDTDDAIGKGSIATIERGVYYVKGYFVLVDSQSIVLDKYGNVPSYRVGLTVKESIVTPEQDSSLLDNAMGSSNYSAPGAHRYFIDLILSKTTLAEKTDSNNFVELGQIQSGRIVKQVTTTEYNELEATLARRTYDESGDYTVRPFKVSVREHRNNDRGQWKLNTEYQIGDVVRNFGNAYVAKTKGTETSGNGPSAVFGTETTGKVEWEYVVKPPLNNGVHNAEGKVVRIEILDGGSGYVSQPSISFSSKNNVGGGASATAIVSEGKVVEVIIDNPGEGYTSQTLEMTFDGGHSSNSDKNVKKESEKTATAIAYTDAGNSDKLSIGVEGGKAYVQGFELEKMGTTWVDVDKSRTLDTANLVFLMPNVGNYFRVENISGIPPLLDDKDNTIELYDQINGNGNIIGKARLRGIEPEGNGSYKMFVYDLSLESGKSVSANVKGFQSEDGFRATVKPLLNSSTLLNGSISVINVQNNGEAVIEGKGTTFKTQLKKGDYILTNDTYIRVVDNITQNSFSGFVENYEEDKFKPLSDVAYYLVTTEICEPQGISAIYDLPHNCVHSTDIGNIDYYVTYVSQERCDANGTIVFSCDKGTFASTGDSDNYLLLDEKGHEVKFEPINYTLGSRNITLQIKDFSGTPSVYTLIATLHKVGTGTNNSLGIKKSVSMTVARTKQSEVTSQIINLDVVDAYKLVSVKMYPNVEFGASTMNATEYVDITDRYTFHDGQTNSHYGQSYIKLKGGYNAPEHPITIEFFHFKREVEGDYYTVQSYDVNYGDIPSFNGRRLSDVIDFRPDIEKNGIPTKNTMVKRGTEIQLSYDYYLARKDKICIDYLGNIVVVKGISSLNPQIPESPSLSMDICNVELSPYTFDTSTKNVNIELIDNKRYTMRDIGRLDRRITNLEEFTTLSLLELQTEALMVRDSEGYDRFKNGFVVDNFGSTLLLNTDDEGCNCAIDTKNGICRPPFTAKNVSLFEYLGESSKRDDSNYMLYGKLITLPLEVGNEHVAIVEQPLATQIQNVNPFAIVSFVGNLSVNPSSDDWFETKYLPDIINNVEGNYLSTKNAMEGTKWNSWQVTWTGEKVETDKTVSTYSTGQANWNLTTYTTTTTTYAQQQGQSRTGVKTTVTATTDYELVGDRLISTTNIPYMRSRWLLVRAFNLKPYTRYIPKFDGVNVDYWCVPASKVEISNLRGKFDATSGAGSDAKSNARKIETTENSYWAEMTDRTCLDVGDVVVGKSSGRTAVVVGTSYCTMEKDRKNFSHCLYVVNIKSANGSALAGRDYNNGVMTSESVTFEKGETISALNSISKAEAMVGGMDGSQLSERYTVEGNKNHKYDELITNGSGELYFMFWIPDKDMVDYTNIDNDVPVFQFKCGDRVLSLHENENETSNGQVVYSAVGILNTRQKSINAVRNAIVTSETISENRTITNTSSTTNTVSRYLDPLAQSFVIGDAVTGGCFLSKVDIYFATKPKDENPLPITLQIRTVENGVPTGKVLPFANVTLRPDQVNISDNLVSYVDMDGEMVTTAMYDTPTTFVFESPVYVEDTSEYAIVLLSDSNEYNVWIAQLGATIPGKETIVSKQPHMGVLFKSQNASTWSPIQNQDLMFTLYRANFKVSDKEKNAKYLGNVKFATDDLKPHYLLENSFQTAEGSSFVRVWDYNHGLTEGMEVKFEYDDINAVDDSKLLTGNITSSNSVTYVKGVGTRFFYELQEGDELMDSEGNSLGTVSSITNNNELYLKANATSSYEGKYTKNYEEDSLNGIQYSTLLNNTFRVEEGSVNFNSYVINVGEPAKSSGYCGKAQLKANYVLNYDVIQPIFTAQNFSDTSVSYELQTITGTSSGSDSQIVTPFYPIVENENNVLVEPMAIYNKMNLTSSNKDTPSLVFSVTMSSSNSCLSPIIDTDRMSAILINNNFDDPTEKSVNDERLDAIPIMTNTDALIHSYGFCGSVVGCNSLVGQEIKGKEVVVTVSDPDIKNGITASVNLSRDTSGVVTDVKVTEGGYGYTKAPKVIVEVDGAVYNEYTANYKINQIYTSDPNNIIGARDCREGEYIEVKYAEGNNVLSKVEDVYSTESVVFITTNEDLSDLEVEADSIVVRRAAFVDETAPIGGTVLAKYITKPISLASSCNYLRIMMSMCVPQTSNIDVYYKTYQNGGSKQYNDVNWVYATPTNAIKKVEIGSDVFTDVEFDVEYKDGDVIPSFDVVAVKVVFRGTNTAAVPKIKDLRIIACE